jgi:DNA-binding winged helix-turn-helix (wHTH) protein/TolB-like protein/Flp pilus assembly protein TadD
MEEKHSYRFDMFHVDVTERRLTRGDVVIPLTPKVFDTLLVLLENSGRTLDKDQLMQRLWPNTFVEESTLAQNIFQLRKALGKGHPNADYIETIPKRGYRFCANVLALPSDNLDALVLKRHSQTTLVIEQETDTEATEPELRRSASPLTFRVAIATGITFLAVLIGGALLRQPPRVESSKALGSDIKTLAVLPFRPFDQASDDEQMRLGMADALISRLSNLRPIAVRPTSATLTFGGVRQNAIEAGRELRVDAVLEGTVQRFGDRLRINVQLVCVRDGTAVWSEKFDEPFTDILSIQDSISEQVSTKLIGQLSNDVRPPAKRHTKNTEAYQQYVRGRYFWNKRTEEGYKKSLEHFQQAIEIDPSYGLAYAGVADCYLFLALDPGTSVAPEEHYKRARAAATRALELDETMAEAYTTLAAIRAQFENDWPGAEKAYQQAIAANPNYSTAHHWYGWDLLVAGRSQDALSEMRKAQELDPLSLNVNTALGQLYYYLRRYDEAVAQLQETLDLAPEHLFSRIFLGMSYEQKGMLKEAVAEYQKVLEGDGNNVIARAATSHANALMKRPAPARRILDQLSKTPDPKPLLRYQIATVCVALGDEAAAWYWLQSISANGRRELVVPLKFDPQLDPLRTDRRFKSYL